MIPAQLTLSAIQDFARDTDSKLNTLLVGNVDMKGRRIIGAGPAVSKFDYVTKLDMDRVQQSLKTQLVTTVTDGLLRTVTAIQIGAFATRGAPTSHANEMFVASDHNYVSWVSDGAAWHWQSGVNYVAQSGVSALVALLGTNDVGYEMLVTDFTHRMRWSG